MAKSSSTAYADQNYQRKKAIYDVIAQCIEDIKYGLSSSGHTWNLPAEQIQGVTARFMGENSLEVTYHHYEVGTSEDLARMKLEETGKKYIDKLVKEIKKRFKAHTDRVLTLKEISSDSSPEKASRLSAEASWLLSSTSRGFGNRPVGRYIVKDSAVYEFSAKLEK